MITNTDCTILTRSINPFTRQYEWSKTIYRNVYFECYQGASDTSEASPNGKDNCYCCIYEITSINAKICDIIAKGEITESDINITDIQNKYQTFSITKISIYDTGNIKHIELEGT